MWGTSLNQEKKLNTFHHQCIKSILGISNGQQWSEPITMAKVRRRWGDEEASSKKVKKKLWNGWDTWQERQTIEY